MTLKLNGSTDGSVSLQAPADTSPTGSDITLTLPTTVGSANQFVKNGGTAGELEYSSMVEDSSGDVQARRARSNTAGDVALSVQPSDSSIHYGLRIDASNNNLNLDKVSGTAANLLTIDSSGRLLVGPTSYSDSDRFVVRGNANDDDEAFMSLMRGSAPASNQNIGMLSFHGNGNQTEAARITVLRDGGTWTAGSSHPGRITFSTTADGASSPTERFRIASDGSAYVKSTSHGLEAFTSQGAGTSKYVYRGSHSSGATIVFNVWSNGNVESATNSYGGISDVKLKENIVDANSQWDDLKAIQVRNYNFKEETGQETHRQIGVVAQELEAVSPGLVIDIADIDNEGNDLGTVTKRVNYSVLYMKAVKALQEAQTRIETLETQNTAQQAQIDDLLARVTALEAAE